MSQKKAIFVSNGQRMEGSLKVWFDSLGQMIELELDESGNKKALPLTVAENAESALSQRPDILIFREPASRDQALEIKKQNPHLQILVFNGLFPNNEHPFITSLRLVSCQPSIKQCFAS
jgi:hypothetical protein